MGTVVVHDFNLVFGSSGEFNGGRVNNCLLSVIISVHAIQPTHFVISDDSPIVFKNLLIVNINGLTIIGFHLEFVFSGGWDLNPSFPSN